MARRKVTKPTKAKSTLKHPVKTKASGLTSTDALEKQFRETPAKLAMQLRKDLALITQQEKKLKAELKKSQNQKKTAIKQRVTLAAKSKKNLTPQAKKQLFAAKQHVEKIAKALTTVTAQLADLKQHNKTMTQKHAKFVALHKHLATFETQWGKKTRKVTKNTTTPRKKSIKSIAPVTSISPTHDTTHTHEIAASPTHSDIAE